MLKFFFPALGVGFNDLRQIALTLCHSIVSGKNGVNSPFDFAYNELFANFLRTHSFDT